MPPTATDRAMLRLYLGAAPGVGKTWQMLKDAHALKHKGVDIVIAILETHCRVELEALAQGLECVPLDGVIARQPQVALVDELAHTNTPEAKNRKRYEDVLELLQSGVSVMTAVNVQHIESLNAIVAQITGEWPNETVPDHFFQRADEVIYVDVSVDTLRTRLRQGKIYGIEEIEHSLNNFFRKPNLVALRELALRQVAPHREGT